jgi:dTDP-glucose 4,6-dehydratase
MEKSERKLLVTGGCGFIGSNFIRYTLENYPGWQIVNLDKLTYAGNPENVLDFEQYPRYCFYHTDITSREDIETITNRHKIDTIVNFAAESHVDRSILSAEVFIETNVKGVLVLLESARRLSIKRYIQISTDEVYGELGESGTFTELSPIQPNSPYAASKASADHLVKAYFRTYGVPAIITRCSNNFGPYQFPEKLIPLMIINALEGKPLPVYGDGMNIRDWIYVKDHCKAICTVIEKGKVGETYNIGGNTEKTNLEVVRLILKILNRPETLITYVKDRPGHDRRYAIDFSKLKHELDWFPTFNFEDALRDTIHWYIQNKQWWHHILSGEYKTYYREMYENRTIIE